MTAIAAVDVALWDIKAKVAKLPLYQLLGGRSRDKIMTYTHANGVCIDSTLDAVGKAIDDGYQAVRVQSGIPGLDSTYGVAKEGKNMNLPMQPFPVKMFGVRKNILTLPLNCLTRCVLNLATTFICYMTFIIV